MTDRCAYCGSYFVYVTKTCRDEITCQVCTRNDKDRPLQFCVDCSKQLTKEEIAYQDGMCTVCATRFAEKLQGLLEWMDVEDILKPPRTNH